MTSVGEAKIDDVLLDFTNFYKNRLSHNLKVDRQNCPFTKEFTKVRKNVVYVIQEPQSLMVADSGVGEVSPSATMAEPFSPSPSPRGLQSP